MCSRRLWIEPRYRSTIPPPRHNCEKWSERQICAKHGDNDMVISVMRMRTPRHEAINEMRYRSGRLTRRRKTRNNTLRVPAHAPEPAGNELLIVLFVILAAPPCSLLVISNYRRSLIKNTLKSREGACTTGVCGEMPERGGWWLQGAVI